MKTIRFIFGLPILLVGLAMALFALFEFGKGLFTWSGTSAILGLGFIIGSMVVLKVAHWVFPKDSATTTTTATAPDEAKKA